MGIGGLPVANPLAEDSYPTVGCPPAPALLQVPLQVSPCDPSRSREPGPPLSEFGRTKQNPLTWNECYVSPQLKFDDGLLIYSHSL